MGCWNGTCNLTNMSISCNDEVVGFIVKLNPVSGNACYINTHGSPEFLPIIGKYNDYGSIEGIKEAEALDGVKYLVRQRDFEVGDKLGCVEYINRLLYVVTQADTIEEAVSIAEQAIKMIKIKT